MRYHENFGYLPSSESNALSRLVSADNLAVARLEPAHRQIRQTMLLDLVFRTGDNIAVVPGIIIDGPMISERESTPLIWPRAAYDAIDHEQLIGVQTEVEYWLFSLALGKQICEPAVWLRQRDFVSTYEFARECGFIGAELYPQALQRLAPYVYGSQLSRAKTVCVRDPHGSSGGALLTRHASAVRVDLGSAQRNAAACKWYGRDIFGPLSENCEVAIASDGSLRGTIATIDLSGRGTGRRIDIARPVPIEVMISFDPQDSGTAGYFHVEAPTPALRGPAGQGCSAPFGGSSGTIALALREDAMRADDADSDDALELAERLRREGFEVITGTPAQLAKSVEDADLLHVSTLAQPHDMLPLLRAARNARKPVVARAHLEDVSSGPAWGMALAHMLDRLAADEVALLELLGLFSKRRLETEQVNAKHQEPYPGYDAEVRQALSLCDALLVSGPAEETFVRSRGYVGAMHVAPPIAKDPVAPASIERIISNGDFVFAHAPIAARANPFLLLRAARQARLPLVLAGPVIDADVYMLLRESADETIIFALDPTPAELAALYRSARVFADVGWTSQGGHRLAHAALSGAGLVCSSTHYHGRLWSPAVCLADPASVDSIAQALQQAWAAASGNREAHRALVARLAA
ncbi:MAG: hypothetical protein JO165_07205, partial [Candidatus Eremiobacteraeota bacterium]|nr:hypothetical protein [Candidatus Eremiobacteraeota bacterium]